MPEPIPAPCDDGLLLRRLRSGEDAAYADVIRMYGGRLLAGARRILGNEEDARDVVQETMLAAFRSVARFEGASSVSTWLHRIMVNASLMRLRTRRRRPEATIDPLLPEFTERGHFRGRIPRWAEPADAAIARRELCALVQSAIARLPEGHRAVLVLRDVEGLSIEEVAAAIETTPGAAKVRVHRARQALRTLLDPHMRAEAV